MIFRLQALHSDLSVHTWLAPSEPNLDVYDDENVSVAGNNGMSDVINAAESV